VTPAEVHLIVPGSIEQRSGGSIYDRRMADGLRGRGWRVVVHELRVRGPIEGTWVERAAGAQPGRTPQGLDAPRDASMGSLLDEALAGLPDGALVVVDGLASRASPASIRSARDRLRLLVLVHLLAADDPGLAPADRAELDALERQGLAASSGVIASTPLVARLLSELGIDPARVRTAPPGNDPAPEATGPPPGAPPQLLCVAAVIPGKRQDLLVRALARLGDLPWTCVVAGSLTRDVAYAASVRAQVHDAGLADRIFFPGELDRDALGTLYLASSVFVLPSAFETYGLVLVEAMARGLPIVATRVGAIPDTVPADAGILVAPADDADLAGAVRSLLEDTPGEPASALRRRQQLGAAGRRHAARLPDWEQAAAELERAIVELAPPHARTR
jgi:glycosyltransferase involved in cell wall biosynthesis